MATLVELAVLAADSRRDSQAAIGRLAGIGPVVILVPAGADDAAVTDSIGPSSPASIAHWAGVTADRSLGGTAYSGGGRRIDPVAIAQLKELQAEHEAGWLIATEGTLASARACPGLHVVCVGPAPDEADPTRPDHRAHSLLDAARFIETSLAFT
ncbi:MAG TPA: hypothetical protein VID26_12315 [Candidatus Limnocylindrales bacterium]|jgi:hypothetical protein